MTFRATEPWRIVGERSAYEIVFDESSAQQTFHLIGEFAAATAMPLRRRIGPRLTGGKPVTIDCSRLRAIDTTVVSTLVASARLAWTFATPFTLRNLAVAVHGAVAGDLLRNEALIDEDPS